MSVKGPEGREREREYTIYFKVIKIKYYFRKLFLKKGLRKRELTVKTYCRVEVGIMGHCL